MSMICSGLLSFLKPIQRIGYIFLRCGRGPLMKENTGWLIYKFTLGALFLWEEVHEEEAPILPDCLAVASIAPSTLVPMFFFHGLDQTDQDANHLPMPEQQLA